MTEDNLGAAFAGESQAHVKYAAFSEKAEREGKPNVARLVAAASYAEQVHASAHLRYQAITEPPDPNVFTDH